MVDALHEVHRILAARGTLVDARPDSRVVAYAEQVTAGGHRRIGTIDTAAAELANDRVSDQSVARVVREGLFRRRRHGRFWHRVPFDDLAGLGQYLREHLRFVHRPKWAVDPATRRRIKDERFTIRRAVRYELLERRARWRRAGD
jgi:hypothetical protein